MKNLQQYDTEDVEERSVTLALRDLLVSITRSGMTEDPLSLVCKSLVRCIDAVVSLAPLVLIGSAIFLSLK